MKTRGEAVTVVLLVLALGGLAFAAFRPKGTHGESKRAAASTEATAQLVTAVDAQGASAAASVVKIGEANAEAPASAARSFIAQEVPVVLAKLPAPDPAALIEAEKRKAAVLEGRLDEAKRLYGEAMKRADELERERAAALAERRAVDLLLEQKAAESLGALRQRNQILIVAGLLLGLYVWTKFTHASPGDLADALKYVRKEGDNAEVAIDAVTSPLQKRIVRFISKFQ